MDLVDNSWSTKYAKMYQELENKDNAFKLETITMNLDSDLISDEDPFKKAYNQLINLGEKKLADKWILPYIQGY